MSIPTSFLPPAVVKEVEEVPAAYNDIVTVQYTSGRSVRSTYIDFLSLTDPRSFAVSALALLIWDYAVTFDDEVSSSFACHVSVSYFG